ncbi:hypothetical protein [Ktedonospora formicarum]|uniref:Histidine kinase n=1 Tax=Ktedonospora formicarum TaxID=2778364 RepID=A0A8J3I7M8_9CHLR|nr:hypothetical protein [Ktedonospora formicarum]GHO51044.1 hypothetical protein KSX_92070 [Ktedonospora formicarum]
MTQSNIDVVKSVKDAPINYALLKLIHHEVGNGLAVLSGYRHLLQRTISARAQETFPPTQEAWQDRNDCCLGYLQTMQDREKRLNDLLAQLRELAPEATDERLCQNKVRADLVAIFRQVIEQRIPLYPDGIVQVSIPTQPLFIMCDSFWLQALFEHILLNYIFTGQTVTKPAEIHLAPFSNLMGQEAQITIRFKNDLPRHTTEKIGEFGAEIRIFEHGEVEACLALCHEILHEHGGQIWSEQEGGFSLALPLVD